MRKLAKKRDSAKDAADYGAPRPFHHNAGPITGGLVSRPRPGLSERSRSGDARRALAVANQKSGAVIKIEKPARCVCSAPVLF